jgi:beta-galactosidase
VITQDFNNDWTFNGRGSLFEQGSKKETVPVNLPNDLLLTTTRSAAGNPHLGYFGEGDWEYKKSFAVPADWAQRRATLQFDGVYRNAMVFVNNAFAGQFAAGYSLFEVALDPFLVYGATNEVRVEVQVHEDSRWYSGGGIYRPVTLLLGDLLHIAPNGLRVTTPDVEDDMATVAITAEIRNDNPTTRAVDAAIEIRDARGEVVSTDDVHLTILAGERTTLRHRSFVRDPRRWSVEDPNLYTAHVRLRDQDDRGDEASTTFGIRTVTVDSTRGLRVNGAPVKLRGACLHHDHGVIGAAEFPRAADRRVAKLKAAGFNAVRFAAKPGSRAMLDACDRLGMLVIDEAWDMWHMSKTQDDLSRRFEDWWERDVDALIAKDFNHPSVILYGVGSEIIEIGTPYGSRIGRLITDRIRRQDPTRFISNSINGLLTQWVDLPGHLDAAEAPVEESGEAAPEWTPQDDTLNGSAAYFAAINGLPVVGERLAETAATLDVVGWNYGDVRYEQDHALFPNRVMLGSETFPTRIADNWRTILDSSYVIGDFTWVGWDYLGEPGVGRPIYPGEESGFTAPYPGLTADCADIDLIGRRLPISYYREIVFGLRTAPYLAVQRPEHREHPMRPNGWAWFDSVSSWTWDVEEGSPITVEAYADADEIAFLVNGEEVARSVVGEIYPLVAMADIAYHRGVIEAIAFKDGIERERFALTSTGPVTQVRVSSEQDSLAADTQDIAFIDIALTDAEGEIVPLADARISVEVHGPARLLGLGTARPSTEESFLDSACTTYEGRALAVLRYTGTTSDGGPEDAVRVVVTSPNLPEATYTVPVAG